MTTLTPENPNVANLINMMNFNTRNWKGLLLGLAAPLLGFGTARAQNPTSIDIDLVQNVTPGTLEVRVRANGDDFGDVLSTLTFTIRWATTSPATLGTRVNTCPSGIPLTATAFPAQWDPKLGIHVT